MPGKKPAPVSIEHDGIRYDAIHNGKARDLKQNGGHVSATDIASGRELWLRQAYKITYGPMSPQKYDRFISSMEIVGDTLSVKDDSGETHAMPLKAGLWGRIKAMLGL